MLVVLLHCIAGITDSKFKLSISEYYNLKPFGAIGVDIFFVISGFIIAQVAKKNNGFRNSKKFIVHRFLRIIPMYYICSIPALIWKIKTHLFKFPELLNTVLILPFFPLKQTAAPLLFVGWTLAYEWFFYILFACMICFFPKQKIKLMLYIMIILSITGFIFMPEQPLLKLITSPLLLEFVFGIVTGLIYSKKGTLSLYLNSIILAAGILSFILLFYAGKPVFDHFIHVSAYFDLQHVLFVSIPCFLLVTGCLLMDEKNKLKLIFNNRLLLLIGDASYSLYLIHFYCISFLIKISLYYFPHIDGIILLPFIFFFCVCAGIICYKKVEKKILRILARVSDRN